MPGFVPIGSAPDKNCDVMDGMRCSVCKPGYALIGGSCVKNSGSIPQQENPFNPCLGNAIYVDGICKPCGKFSIPDIANGRVSCIPCPSGQQSANSICIPSQEQPPMGQPCLPGEIENPDGTGCIPQSSTGPCPTGLIRNNNGKCIPIPCPGGYQKDINGLCVLIDRAPGPRPDGKPPIAGMCPSYLTLNPSGTWCIPSDKPCPPGQIKDTNGICIQCKSDRDCGPNMRCYGGKCVTGGAPPAGQKPACKINSDCGPNMRCYGGKCVAAGAPPTGQKPACKINSDCGPNMKCLNGKCVSGGGAPPAEQKPACKINSDCGPNMRCLSGKCVPRKKPSCYKDKDCGPNMRCSGGKCIPERSTCKSNIDCGPNMTCLGGKCAPGGLLPPPKL